MSLENITATILETIPEHEDFAKANLIDVFVLPEEKLVRVRDLLDKAISKGLDRETHHDNPHTIFPSFVEGVPDGSESGTYLAVDLGGTYSRVLVVNIDNQTTTTKITRYTIPQSCHANTGTNLFDFIADGIHSLLTECNLLNTKDAIELGFTFSFPVENKALNSANLIGWTKDFHDNDVIGRDVVQQLEKAIIRKGDMNIKCCAILNDTIGTLISGAFIDRCCSVGLICGTGTNGCCFEPIDHIEDYKSVHTNTKSVAIDTRWNDFGSDETIAFIRSDIDKEILRDTTECQMGIEKMMSGMFIGEVVRRVLLKLNGANIMPNIRSDQWNSLYSLRTDIVSDILRIGQDNLADMNDLLASEGVNHLALNECRFLHCVCQLAVIRAAHITAACTACVVNRVGLPTVGIAVDGSVYKNMQLFRDFLAEKVKSLVNHGVNFYFVPCEDGSGLGAAIIAAMESKRLSDQKK